MYLYLSHWYCTTIKKVKVLSDIPYCLPDYLSTFPSDGECYWLSQDWWGDKHVIWGRHKGNLAIAQWRYNTYRADGSVYRWSSSFQDATRNPTITLENYYDDFIDLVREQVLQDNIEYNVPQFEYGLPVGYQLFEYRNGRKWIFIYITSDNEFCIYFSHFRKDRKKLSHWLLLL
jgi:hypothetical protein